MNTEGLHQGCGSGTATSGWLQRTQSEEWKGVSVWQEMRAWTWWEVHVGRHSGRNDEKASVGLKLILLTLSPLPLEVQVESRPILASQLGVFMSPSLSGDQ